MYSQNACATASQNRPGAYRCCRFLPRSLASSRICLLADLGLCFCSEPFTSEAFAHVQRLVKGGVGEVLRSLREKTVLVKEGAQPAAFSLLEDVLPLPLVGWSCPRGVISA